MVYNTNREFPKIVGAFDRVKYDVSTLFQIIDENKKVQQSQEVLIQELQRKVSQLNSSRREKTVVRTIVPRTVTKKIRVGEKIAIVGNNLSKKAHRETCPYAKNIKKEHFVKFRSQMDAFKKGFSACSCMKGKAKGKK